MVGTGVRDGYLLLVHPSCPSSRAVLLGLYEHGLLDRVKVASTLKPAVYTGLFPWSVPLLAGPDGALAMDPLDPIEVVSIVEGSWSQGYHDPVDQFLRSVLYSAYGSAIALVHGSFQPLMDESFLGPALRLPLLDPAAASRFAEVVKSSAGKLYSESWEAVARALAIAVVRMIYWASRGNVSAEDLQELREDIVSAIILSMASVGRSHLPPKPSKVRASGFVASFIRRGARGLLRKVRQEQELLWEDKDYVRLLGRLGLLADSA